jgi:hypothetical protein
MGDDEIVWDQIVWRGRGGLSHLTRRATPPALRREDEQAVDGRRTPAQLRVTAFSARFPISLAAVGAHWGAQERVCERQLCCTHGSASSRCV